MSRLSELLNPAPTCNAQGSPTGSLSHDAPGDLGQDQKTKTLTLTQTQAGSPTQKSTLESPLETLASAATSSTPLASPTYPLGPPLHSLGASFSTHSSSRPASSRISPPLPLELSHQPEQALGKFSPGLEQYHHSSSHEVRTRRLSDIANDVSRVLPPLRRSLPDESIQTATPLPIEPYHDGINSWHNKINDQSIKISPETLSLKPKQESETPEDPPAVSPGPTKSSRRLLSTDSTTSQQDEVEVKSEAMESSEILQDHTQIDKEGAQGKEYDMTSRRSSRVIEPIHVRNVVDMKQDSNDQPPSTTAETSTPRSLTKPKAAPSRKRAAPKPKVEKKGTASAVKPAKKRKIEPESVNGTPSLQRSGTPASSRASKTPAPASRKRQSVTPARSSSVVIPNYDEEEEGDDDDDEEDNELFCVCRKPDDHTWMIACDGPCQDWFHGRCVGIDEKDGNLIDKYICPNCKANGDSQTTWKPMCRLGTCRNPARVTGNKPSKYCSDDHGIEYMRNLALKGEPEEAYTGGSKGGHNSRKRKRDNKDNGSFENDDTAEIDDTPCYLRGGILRGAELKALVSGINSVAEFRKLGEGVLSPPRTISPDNDNDNDTNMEDASLTITTKTPYTTEESTQLHSIGTQIQALQTRISLLQAREQFLTLVKSRAKSILEHLRKRDADLKRKDPTKDICGYDSRLSWSDEEFARWCSSPEGQQTLDSRVLGPPPPSPPTSLLLTSPPLDAHDPQAHPQPQPPVPNEGGGGAGEEEEEIGKGACLKRHCARHRIWWKVHVQEMAFEKEEVKLRVGRLVEEERGVRERARIRRLEEEAARGGGGGGAKGKGGKGSGRR